MRKFVVACLALVLCSCGRAEKPVPETSGSLPVRIRAFENDAFIGMITISYNGNIIDNVSVADDEDNIVVFATPHVNPDSSVLCQWSWRERRFSGVWHKLNEFSSRMVFDHSSPVSDITKAFDSNGHLGQVIYKTERDTVELVDFSYLQDIPISCAVLNPNDYTLPGRNISWQYDVSHRPVSILYSGEEKKIRLEVEYDKDGEMAKGMWEEVERCAWLPLPIWVARLGL